MVCLPLVAELGDGAVLAIRDEDWIEAEAGRAGRCGRNAARERSGSAQRPPVRPERHELAHVARSPGLALHPVELAQHPADLVAGRAARGMDAGPSAETHDLDARILAQLPHVGGHMRAAELRLRIRVLVVGGA